MNLGVDERAGIEGAAGGKPEDEHHHRLQDDYAPPNGFSHLKVSFVL